MSEPVAYLATNPTHPSNADALVWEQKDWHITWEFKPLYTHPDPRVAELEADIKSEQQWASFYAQESLGHKARVEQLEAVLRECREALDCVPKHFGMKRLGNSTLTDSETRVKCHKAIAKIDEVLK